MEVDEEAVKHLHTRAGRALAFDRYACNNLNKYGVEEYSKERCYKVKLGPKYSADEDEKDETRRRYCECIHILNERFNEVADDIKEIVWGLFWTIEDYRARLCSNSIRNEVIFEAI